MSALTRDGLRGFVPAVVTPFDTAGAIQEEAFRQIVERMIGDGAGGICVAGDNGESWSLSLEERARLTRLAVDQAAGRVPVIAGASAPGSAQTIAYARAARDAGAAAVLVMPQTYVMKATRSELLRRFETLARGVELPVVLYNSPRRAVIELSVDDVEAICGVAPVIGIKESNRDFGHLTRLLMRMGERIAVLVGPAYYILPGVALGASGFLSTAPEFLGPAAGRLMEIGRGAPDAGFVEAHGRLTVLYETLMSLGTWPAALKAGLGLLGLPAGVPRDPVLPLEPAAVEKLKATLERLGLPGAR